MAEGNNDKRQAGAIGPGGFVRYGPLATMVGVSPDGKVMLRVESTTGMAVYLMDPDHAEELGRNIRQAATQARLGLTVIEGRGLEDGK